MSTGLFKGTFLFLLLFASLAGKGLCAQTSASAQDPWDPQDPLVLKLAIIGPGDELYFWWGHIGLIIEDHEVGRARFYDWGIFSFENTNFFANFAFGRLLYTCGVSSPEANFRQNINTNRDVTLYTLNLPPEKKREIKDYAEWSVLPENKDYFYHHFRDNCATRPRDILDKALDGRFAEQYKNTPGRFTLRQQVRRHTWFNPFFDWFLCFLMGRWIDLPITAWDDMFLPSEIAARIQEFRYVDSSGAEQSLVSNVEILNRAVNRPPVLDVPRLQWPRELILGCGIALLFIALRIMHRRGSRRAANALAIGQGAFGLFFGIAGAVLFFMMFFTNHDYTYRNINILFANPLLSAALPFGIWFCRANFPQDRNKWEIFAKTLWTCCLGLALVSILLNTLPFFRQQNQVDLALILPPAAALSWIPDVGIYIRREYLWRWLN